MWAPAREFNFIPAIADYLAFTAATLRQTLGPSLKSITVGPALLVFQDQSKQSEFLRRWRRETGAVK